MQKPEYERGFHDGLTRAVTWLQDHAAQMNDRHARMVLNVAANELGHASRHLKKGRRSTLAPASSDQENDHG